MFTSEQLKKDTIYTRDKLRQIFSIRDATIKNGVFRPAGYQSVWLFITENKTKGSTQYKDLLCEDRLDWDGQTEGRTDWLIIEHEIKGIELLVFYRKNKSMFPNGGFKYEGQFRYVSHTGSKPTHFVLQRVVYVSTKDDAGTSNIKEVREEDASHSYLINKHQRDIEMKKASTTMEQNKQLKLVYCYAREDRTLLEELDKHLRALKRQYEIVIWSDYEISPGAEWEKEIDAWLNTANIILLLVSSDFMASDYCYGVEMKRALERHERGEATVIPVILRPIEWQDTPIGKLQALPKNGKPVVDPEWHMRDYALHDVEKGLNAIIIQQISMFLAPPTMLSLPATSVHLESENGRDPLVFKGKEKAQEDAYRKWVLAHRDDGLVVVKDGRRWTLHHADCDYITKYIDKSKDLFATHKICSTSRAKLDTEATKQGGTILTGCYCQQ
jgi:hypothetical protein